MPLNQHTIQSLLFAQRIKSIDAVEVQQRQLQELDNLAVLKLKKSSYLNSYDQLFRHVSLCLLQYGYDLTKHQPHQSLKAICLANCPDWKMERIIQQRHLLKKRLNLHVDQQLYLELQHCVHYFEQISQAYKKCSGY